MTTLYLDKKISLFTFYGFMTKDFKKSYITKTAYNKGTLSPPLFLLMIMELAFH